MSSANGGGRLLRRLLEAAGWACLVTLLWGTDLVVKFAEREQLGSGKDDFRLVVEQATSAAAVLVMIPFVIRWLKIFPLTREAWVPAIVGHTAGSVLFAVGHYSLMVVLRMVVYALSGVAYIWREPFFSNLVVEYQKDIKVYLGILVIVIAYRQLPISGRRETAATPGRLLVQTGTGTALLRYDEIDYLEAARNYVSVHAGGREYVVRDTMARLSEKLGDGPFVRTHRSYIVNIDRVREIRNVDSKQRIILAGGTDVPLSRSHQEGFRQAVGEL